MIEAGEWSSLGIQKSWVPFIHTLAIGNKKPLQSQHNSKKGPFQFKLLSLQSEVKTKVEPKVYQPGGILTSDSEIVFLVSFFKVWGTWLSLRCSRGSSLGSFHSPTCFSSSLPIVWKFLLSSDKITKVVKNIDTGLSCCLISSDVTLS